MNPQTLQSQNSWPPKRSLFSDWPIVLDASRPKNCIYLEDSRTGRVVATFPTDEGVRSGREILGE